MSLKTFGVALATSDANLRQWPRRAAIASTALVLAGLSTQVSSQIALPIALPDLLMTDIDNMQPPTMLGTNSVTLSTLASAAAAPTATTPAGAYTPSVKIGRGALVSPSAASTFYGSATTWTDSVGASGRSNEIVELARALRNDPDLIYDFVRNNIDMSWTYGLQKGALGAIVDRSGTAFDQANLMVELLKQAGFSASYRLGSITLNGAQFSAWSGIVNAQAACNLLASGGIPAVINGSTPADCISMGSAQVSSVQLEHAWVSVVISGSTYVFDPAYKTYSVKAGQDIRAIAGLVSGSAMGLSGQGMTSGTEASTPYVRQLNSTALNNSLKTLGSNILNFLNANPAMDLEDLVGGREIAQLTLTTPLRQTALPYSSTTRLTATDIPDQYRSSLNVQLTKARPTGAYDLIVNKLLFVDQIYGRKLIFDTNFDDTVFRGSLRLTDERGIGPVLVRYETPATTTEDNVDNPGFSVGDLTLTANHPYATAGDNTVLGSYMDETVIKRVKYSLPMTIIHAWGDSGKGLVEKWGARSDSLYFTPTPPGCETCGASAFTTKGDGRREQYAAAWIAQSSIAARLHAQIAKSLYTHHHSIGISSATTTIRVDRRSVAGQPNNYEFYVTDSFDRIDVDSAISLTSTASNAAERRAGLHAIAATIASLESGVIQQIADLPDSASVANRFEWSNTPPPAPEDPSGVGARRFYEFSAANSADATNLVKVEGTTSNNNSGTQSINECVLKSSEVSSRRGALAGAVRTYTEAGFSAVISEEAASGSGQRCGAFIPNTRQQDPFTGGSTGTGTRWPSQQRGGALVATRYEGADPVEIAHIVIGPTGYSKGGGGGVQTTHQAEYDPAKSADILKSKFVDKSTAVGVDLKGGNLTYTSPATLSVGNGGFPYQLDAQLIWRGGAKAPPEQYEDRFQPQTPWTTNWNNTLSVSGSGLVAMGDDDARAAAGTIAAFLLSQDAYAESPSLQREVVGVLINSWWVKKLSGNVVSSTIGANTAQFYRDVNDNWFSPGSRTATLIQIGQRVAEAQSYCAPGYILSKGWKYSAVSFSVKSAQADVQNFPYWEADINDGETCLVKRGFRLSKWTFPQGVTIDLDYVLPSVGLSVPELAAVRNSLGRRIRFNESGLRGFDNGLTGAEASSVLVNEVDQLTTTHTNGAGEVSKFVYLLAADATRDEQKLLHRIFTPQNQSAPSLQYDYDTLQRVRQASDGVALQRGGRQPYQFFIAEGARGERIDPAGGRYVVRYDLDGRASVLTNELGFSTKAFYDGRDRPTAYVYPEGDQELLGYDIRNNLNWVKKIAKPGSGLADLIISAAYHPNCNKITELIDAKGNSVGENQSAHRTLWQYNATSCLLDSVTQPGVLNAASGAFANPVTSYLYNSRGQKRQVTDPSGLVVRYGYDDSTSSSTFGYLTSNLLDPGSSPRFNLTTFFGYDPTGNVTSVTDPRGKTTTYTYDKNRRTTVVTGPVSTCIKSENVYTGGLLTKVRKASKCSPVQSTDADWQVTTTTYSPTEKPEVITDPSGYRNVTAYDALDRPFDLTQCLEAGSSGTATCPTAKKRVTRNEYDLAGQLLKVYKAFGSPDQITYSSQGYTANGQVDFTRDANNNLTDLSYDGFDRLSRMSFADSSYEEYFYDPNSNLYAKRNRSGRTIGFAFDALNREIARTVPSTPDGFARTLTTTYDLASRKWDITADGQTLQNRYDTAGRPNFVGDTLLNSLGSNIGNITYAYDGSGNRNGFTVFANGSSWSPSYDYDDAGRLQQVRAGTTNLALYGLNPLSQRKSTTLLDGTSVAYDYYPNSDLKTLTHNWSGSSLTLGYTRNGARQIMGMTLSDDTFLPNLPDTARNYSTNNLNQYVAVGSNGLIPSSNALSYDGNGNLIGDGVWTYGYDEENRLRRAVGNSKTVTYDYDPVGRRRAKTVNGLITYFVNDQAGNELLELDSAGSRQRLYVAGDGQDDHIGMYADSTGAWEQYHGDHQGSALLTTIGANLSNRYKYGPYGESSDPATGNPFRYTGRYLDAETGLYYYRARYYSTALGRFLQTDPIGSEDDLNLYSYVKNDPLNLTDPQGRYSVTVDSILGFGGGVEIGYNSVTTELAVTVRLGAGIAGGGGIDLRSDDNGRAGSADKTAAGVAGVAVNSFGEATVDLGPASLGAKVTAGKDLTTGGTVGQIEPTASLLNESAALRGSLSAGIEASAYLNLGQAVSGVSGAIESAVSSVSDSFSNTEAGKQAADLLLRDPDRMR